MNWLVFLISSVSVLVLTLISAVAVYMRNYKFGRILNPLNVIVSGVFVACYLIILPVKIQEFSGDLFAEIKTVLISLHNVLQMFSVDADFGDVSEIVSAAAGEAAPIYLAYTSVLFVLAPVLTFGFILSLFKNISASIRYFFNFYKEVYVFSELNSRALVLADDIKKNHPRALIVYTDVFETGDEKSYELLESAMRQRAICFKKDITAINFARHSRGTAIYFFAIGMDETENTNQALQLIKRYGDRENTHLYVFCTNVVGSLILSSPMKMKMKVRRIDEAQSLINRQLYEGGNVFFDTALPIDGSEDKQISAVVVGLGRYGSEMVKSLSWFCQMDGYKIKITAFDKDPLAEERFSASCPELMSSEYNGVKVEGEAEYKIKIHSDVSVSTKDFRDKIKELKDATYVLVCLGNDELNIETAIDLRTVFEGIGAKPVIQAVVNNNELKTLLDGVTNFQKQPYDVEFIGDFKSSYTEDVIIDNELEEEAVRRHMKYGVEEDFWKYEYNYRSSVASAIHLKARIDCDIKGASKAEDELTEEEIAIIEPLEHRRWNAYMRSRGYVYSGSLDPDSRNDLAKKHHNLVPFKKLTDEDKLKDRRVGTK